MAFVKRDKIPGMKWCPGGCNKYKPLDEFKRNRGRGDGRGGYCRPCNREKNRGYESYVKPAASRYLSQSWGDNTPGRYESDLRYKPKPLYDPDNAAPGPVRIIMVSGVMVA